MSDDARTGELSINVTVKASAWKQDDGGWSRRWVGLPIENDLAADVERKAGWWPFNEWTWTIYAPFMDESMEDGRAATAEEAMAAADAAMVRLAKSGASSRIIEFR